MLFNTLIQRLCTIHVFLRRIWLGLISSTQTLLSVSYIADGFSTGSHSNTKHGLSCNMANEIILIVLVMPVLINYIGEIIIINVNLIQSFLVFCNVAVQQYHVGVMFFCTVLIMSYVRKNSTQLIRIRISKSAYQIYIMSFHR